MTADRHDVLVIGGGPAGAAAGFWLAKAGHDVCVLERKAFPRDKTCGDGLTPRAVHQLRDMGLEPAIAAGHHRHDGLRAVAHGITLELRWPEHPVFPDYGYVVRRRDLDQIVADHAAGAGATLLTATEAVRPLLRDGLVTGALVKDKASGATREVRARYVIVADGSLSRFGRALGTARNKAYPQGIAIRGYFDSPASTDPWIESCLDVRDRQGQTLPGYGWIFPLGDGTINVGIGLLSTFKGYKDVNTTHLMTEWAATAPERWGIDPDAILAPPTGGRLPMAGSVNPKVGPNWVLVGDAAGSINPFNGEGIDYAYETARLAADLVDEAMVTGTAAPLARYPAVLDDEYGLYFKVARNFAKIIGQPVLMRELTRVGMRSQSLMEWVLRIMANLLRDDEIGPAEAAYRSVARIARMVPDPAPA
ncbi:MAG TPA: geranylgeranyl reductase family protein [Acidimicrobiales bacterium]|nr:geranylgeranyl reductase family protein [Acidimicrobiales bacterium]HEU0171500.1 geranylgeranyl reductase family protein [Acidimicrobiales bacterium]